MMKLNHGDKAEEYLDRVAQGLKEGFANPAMAVMAAAAQAHATLLLAQIMEQVGHR